MIANATFLLLGLAIGSAPWWALSRLRIAKRKAQADELRFLISPIVQHSTIEDAARRAGC